MDEESCGQLWTGLRPFMRQGEILQFAVRCDLLDERVDALQNDARQGKRRPAPFQGRRFLRFQRLHETFGDAFEAIELNAAAANPEGPRPPHSVLTNHLIDEAQGSLPGRPWIASLASCTSNWTRGGLCLRCASRATFGDAFYRVLRRHLSSLREQP
jgi:hypothetical protein